MQNRRQYERKNKRNKTGSIYCPSKITMGYMDIIKKIAITILVLFLVIFINILKDSKDPIQIISFIVIIILCAIIMYKQ